jgi:hypothetical protein
MYTDDRNVRNIHLGCEHYLKFEATATLFACDEPSVLQQPARASGGEPKRA